MTDFMEATPSESRRPDEIESEIRRTRERMGGEIEAIGDKFRPERIKQRAKQAISRKGANLFRTAKENPVPTAIVALGLAWLLKSRSKQRDSENGYASEQWSGTEGEGFKQKAQEAVGAAGEKLTHTAERVGEKAKETGYTLQTFFERNPVIAGAGVVVLGAAIGALIPETEKENKLMGHARDEIVDKTRNVVQQAQGAMEQKLSERSSSQTMGQSHGAYQQQ